jgi:16S rRNA (guanine527-N7)-methyltransferase
LTGGAPRDELRGLLEACGVEGGLAEPLARFGALVLETNRRFNLTGAKSAAEIAPHIVDSLSVVPYVREPYVDIGSGGGFPAVPVAIATRVPVTMIETTVKKARFLQEALEAFELRGEVVAARAEVAGHDERLRERFASGTARAVALAPVVAELLLPFIEPGGAALLQRGTVEPRERQALEDAALMLGAGIEEETALEGERRIIILRKGAPTPLRFPRRTGVPEKRPLCYHFGTSRGNSAADEKP